MDNIQSAKGNVEPCEKHATLTTEDVEVQNLNLDCRHLSPGAIETATTGKGRENGSPQLNLASTPVKSEDQNNNQSSSSSAHSVTSEASPSPSPPTPPSKPKVTYCAFWCCEELIWSPHARDSSRVTFHNRWLCLSILLLPFLLRLSFGSWILLHYHQWKKGGSIATPLGNNDYFFIFFGVPTQILIYTSCTST